MEKQNVLVDQSDIDMLVKKNKGLSETCPPPAQNGVKFDADKPDWSLIDPTTFTGMIRVMMFGAEKYDRDNWKKVKDAKRRYWSALLRHLFSWFHGDRIDPESGMSHLDHALCNLYYLKYFETNTEEKE